MNFLYLVIDYLVTGHTTPFTVCSMLMGSKFLPDMWLSSSRPLLPTKALCAACEIPAAGTLTHSLIRRHWYLHGNWRMFSSSSSSTLLLVSIVLCYVEVVFLYSFWMWHIVNKGNIVRLWHKQVYALPFVFFELSQRIIVNFSRSFNTLLMPSIFVICCMSWSDWEC